jgi:hypothetical protein
MADGIAYDDVTRFVSAYMSGNSSIPRGGASGPTGYLLRDIAEAYLAYRDLPASALTDVTALVDSVL